MGLREYLLEILKKDLNSAPDIFQILLKRQICLEGMILKVF
jgi:hypothetical protein